MEFADEMLVLGAVMFDPETRFVVGYLEPKHFREGWQAGAWQSLIEIAHEDDEAGAPRRIRPQRVLDRNQGIDASLIEKAYAQGSDSETLAQIDQIADRILKRWQMRQHIDAAQRVLNFASRYETDTARTVEDTLGYIEHALVETEERVREASPQRTSMGPDDVADRTYDLLMKRAGNKKEAMGVSSGWPMWDRIHRGARPGRLNWLIAPTGLGKTSFMLNLACGICDPHSRNDYSPTAGLVVNLEMHEEDLLTRLAAIRLNGQGELDALELGTISGERVMSASEAARDSKLHVVTPETRTIGAICAAIAQHAIRKDIKWALVDHLFEIEMTEAEMQQSGGRHWPHHQTWIRRLRNVGRRYGLTIEVVGQAGSSDMDHKAGHEPQLSNQQGAKALLNLVDTARVLWFKKKHHVISVKKNRGGQAGVKIGFRFRKHQGRWSEIGPMGDDDDD